MFKSYDQAQNFLLPPSFLDYLGEGHESVILNEIVDGLDFSSLLSSYANAERGTTAYHPLMMVKVLFYGYMNQTFSSRKLAAKTQSDLAFMFLAGDNKPDFRTIARFRTEKGAFLAPIFVQIVRRAQELGLVSFDIVSVDGTKAYADASEYKNADLETLGKQMKKLMKEADEIDAIEDREFGQDDGKQMPLELATKEGREKKKNEIEERKKEIEEKKEEIESKKGIVKEEIENKAKEGIEMTRINSTDKDSRLMQMKRKDWGNGYNPQLATEKQFIVATVVNNAANDVNELIPVLDAIGKTYGIKPDIVLADKGYASEENYEYMEKQGIDGYVPHPKLRQDLGGWKYSEAKDEHADTEGNLYAFKGFSSGKKPDRKEKGKIREPLNEDNCGSKIYQSKTALTEKGTGKTLSISKKWMNHCKIQDQKLSTEKGKALYKKRCSSVEPVFGNIKRNLKFERFSLRGLKGVTIEWNLITMAHNLKKIMKMRPA